MKTVGRLYRERLVDTLQEGVNNSGNVFLLSYSQISSFQISDLRKSLKQTGADMCITKNSIARLALKNLKQEELCGGVDGQTALVWSNADSVDVSKVLVKFAKENENVNVQGGLLEGQFLETADVKKLSDLPSREVLLAQLLGTIQAPLTRLAGALNAKSRELLSILNQLSEKKGGNENG